MPCLFEECSCILSVEVRPEEEGDGGLWGLNFPSLFVHSDSFGLNCLPVSLSSRAENQLEGGAGH